MSSYIVTVLTAHAGGGQALATVLPSNTTPFISVSVCATNADSVKLTPFISNQILYLVNNGAANLAVFPSTVTGTIDGGAGGASVTVNAGASVRIVCLATGADNYWVF